MSKQKHYRQGDLLIVSITKKDVALYAGWERKATPVRDGRIVLLEGEATGHAHTIEACPQVESYEVGQAKMILAGKPITVTHQEHAPIGLPAGDYLVRRQREYDESENRYVAD